MAVRERVSLSMKNFMNRLLAWLKLQWSDFYIDPIDYGIENGIRLIVMAFGLWILLTCARCAGGIVGM